MPLYEYKCQKCGVEFEALVIRASEKKEVECPECSSRELEEKISSFASSSRSADCAPSGGG
jgi:putative FmdB family regulatory protein